jgi:hypothetical protein
VSYLKLFKTTQDHAVGVQSINQSSDNNDAMRDLYDAKHSLGLDGYNTGGFNNPFRAVGRHDDPLVARTVARFRIDSTAAVPVASTIISGPMLALSTPLRMGAGQWRIFVVTPQLFGAVALIEGAPAVDLKATCFVEFNPATGPCVVVSTWNVASAARVDYNFSLILWANAP